MDEKIQAAPPIGITTDVLFSAGGARKGMRRAFPCPADQGQQEAITNVQNHALADPGPISRWLKELRSRASLVGFEQPQPVRGQPEALNYIEERDGVDRRRRRGGAGIDREAKLRS